MQAAGASRSNGNGSAPWPRRWCPNARLRVHSRAPAIHRVKGAWQRINARAAASCMHTPEAPQSAPAAGDPLVRRIRHLLASATLRPARGPERAAGSVQRTVRCA